MLLPLIQAWLIHAKRRKLHRWIGWAALPLAAVVDVSGLRMVQLMAAHNIESFKLVRVKFVPLDLTGLSLFCVFVGLSIVAARRRDIGQHVRWIACSALIPLEAALERLLGNLFPTHIPDLEAGLTAALFMLEAIIVILIIVEWRRDRARLPFPLLLGYYAIMHVIASPVAKLAGFQASSNWFSTL